MWVFDGEQWIQDNGSVESTSTTPKSEQAQQPRWHELVPELQVIEILPTPTKNTIVPPLPLP
jgi:hypothetical protein